MFHLRVFSMSIYQICKSIHRLPVWVIFPDLEMAQGRWCKWYILSWTCLKFWEMFIFSCFGKQCMFLTVRYTLWPLHLKVIFGNCRNFIFLMKNYSKSDISLFILSNKEQNQLQKNLKLVVERSLIPPLISLLLFIDLNTKRLLNLMTWF